MKMCHLQLLHTFDILEKYGTNRSQSRFKNGRFYLNALYYKIIRKNGNKKDTTIIKFPYGNYLSEREADSQN